MSVVRFEISVDDSNTANSMCEFFTEKGMNVRLKTAMAYISGMMPSQVIKPSPEIIVLIDAPDDDGSGDGLDSCDTFSDYKKKYARIVHNFRTLFEELMDKKELNISGEFFSYVLDYHIASPKEFRAKHSPMLVYRSEE